MFVKFFLIKGPKEKAHVMVMNKRLSSVLRKKKKKKLLFPQNTDFIFSI